jgi:hypothetical protein
VQIRARGTSSFASPEIALQIIARPPRRRLGHASPQHVDGLVELLSEAGVLLLLLRLSRLLGQLHELRSFFFQLGDLRFKICHHGNGCECHRDAPKENPCLLGGGGRGSLGFGLGGSACCKPTRGRGECNGNNFSAVRNERASYRGTAWATEKGGLAGRPCLSHY